MALRLELFAADRARCSGDEVNPSQNRAEHDLVPTLGGLDVADSERARLLQVRSGRRPPQGSRCPETFRSKPPFPRDPGRTAPARFGLTPTNTRRRHGRRGPLAHRRTVAEM